MEQWNYKQDFSRLEFELEILTLRLSNWEKFEEYLDISGLHFFTLPETYDRLLEKAARKEDNNNDEEEDEDEDEEEDEEEEEEEERDEIEKNPFYRDMLLPILFAKTDITGEYKQDPRKMRIEILSLYQAIKNSDEYISKYMTDWIVAPIHPKPNNKSKYFFRRFSETEKYSFHHFLQIRYIEIYKSYLPETENIESYINDYLLEKNSPYKSSKTTYTSHLVELLAKKTHIGFKSFLRNEKRRLYQLFDIIFGEGVFKNKFEKVIENDKPVGHIFSTFDCQFFSFLLNTYNDDNGKNFRKLSFVNIDSSYLTIIRAGIINLVREHNELDDININFLFAKWNLAKSALNLLYVNNLNNNIDLTNTYAEQIAQISKQIDDINDKISDIN